MKTFFGVVALLAVCLSTNPVYSQTIVYTVSDTLYCDDPCVADIDVTVLDFVPPWVFQWSSGHLTEDLQNVCGGTYELTVIDMLGNSASVSIQVNTAYGLNISTNVGTSCGPMAGAINITANNGTPPVTFILDGDTASFQNSGVDTGWHALAVIDANGCSASQAVYVPYSEPPVACFTTDVQPCTCGDTLAITFISCSTQGVEHNWLLGGGMMQAPYNQPQQAVTYNEPGSYFAGLAVWNSDGCFDQILIDNYVYLESHAIYMFAEDTFDVGSTGLFQASTSPNYNWSITPSFGTVTSGASTQMFSVYFMQMLNYNVCVSAQYPMSCPGGFCTVQACQTIAVVDTPTGIHQAGWTDNALFVWPNPAGNATQLRLAMPLVFDAHFFLADVTGRLVAHQTVKAGATLETVDLSSMPAGLYLYSFEAPDWPLPVRGKLTVE